jgi:plastocyanin
VCRGFGAFAVVCASLTIPATAAAASKTVYAGGPVTFQNGPIGKKYSAGLNNFVINRVTVNVGDTVVWNGKALAGGFHTVDLPGKGKPLPLFTPTGKLVTGVNDAAGDPFWFNNKLPLVGVNPALFGPSGGRTYNGTKPIDTGLPLGKPKDLKVKFTKAGVYRYFCNVHPGMVGFVVVKKKGQTIPPAKQDAATLAKEEARYIETAKQVDSTRMTGNNVSVGASGPGGVEVFAMFPGKLKVKTGTSVTFAMSKLSRDVHTASFGPASYLNPLSQTYRGAPVPDPKAVYASDPAGTISLNPTSHGNGFANTGVMDQSTATPLPSSGRITFSAPGTYSYICLVRPFMHGTVVVTP